MKILGILILTTLVSLHIPHNSRKYNLSWHTRALFTITMMYIILGTAYYLTH
jgi:hypothetical protein